MWQRAAATYMLLNSASYSAKRRRCSAAGLADLAISSLTMMLTAPRAPITVISAAGRAKSMSPRMRLLLMTSQAPQRAFRVIIVSFGTVVSQ
jgi:hypothetical protein